MNIFIIVLCVFVWIYTMNTIYQYSTVMMFKRKLFYHLLLIRCMCSKCCGQVLLTVNAVIRCLV